MNVKNSNVRCNDYAKHGERLYLFGNNPFEKNKVVVVVNDVIDIRERIEKIREAVENNPVGQTGTDTIVPVSSTIELDTIVAENQRQLKADINT